MLQDMNKNNSADFLLFLLRGDSEEIEAIKEAVGECEDDDKLIERLVEVGAISVGKRPEDVYVPTPGRSELIDRLVRDYFLYRLANWRNG